jgi:peptidoglycan/LPS O-acetylase OafA/YrhL
MWVREEIVRPQPGLQTIAEHLLLIGTPEGLAINIPSWSLVHEMRMVVLFPLLAACVIRADWLCLVASILISWAGDLLCMTWGGDTHEFHSATTLSGAIGATAHFMPYFVAGMVLVKRLDIILAFLKTASPLVLASLWVLAILAMRRREVMISGPGCALILALCLGSPAIRRFLERPLIQYLGIISYSFYLVHVPVLVFVLYVLNGTLPLPPIMAVALVASLALAHLFNIWIDSPAGALGKRLTAHWTQRSANDASKSVV